MSHSDYDYLQEHRRVWSAKPVLQRIYREQFYCRILAARAPGQRTLEIGSGPGLIADIEPSVIRSDILHSPWIHLSVDAHHLPFATDSLDNVIGLDVLHHFSQPLAAIKEITRSLRPGGKLILVEPWITPFSRIVYTHFHQEDCDLSAEPWIVDNEPDIQKQAFDGNAAIPYLLVTRAQQQSRILIPELLLDSVKPFSSLTYLFSFGFKPVNMMPMFLYPFAYALERVTQPLWQRFAALRVLLIWVKK